MSSGKNLVVDDDRNLVALIQMRLEAAGCEVIGTFAREMPDQFTLNTADTKYIILA